MDLVPRIFISFVNDEGKLSAYEDLCQAELGGLTASDLRRLVPRGGNLDTSRSAPSTAVHQWLLQVVNAL